MSSPRLLVLLYALTCSDRCHHASLTTYLFSVIILSGSYNVFIYPRILILSNHLMRDLSKQVYVFKTVLVRSAYLTGYIEYVNI